MNRKKLSYYVVIALTFSALAYLEKDVLLEFFENNFGSFENSNSSVSQSSISNSGCVSTEHGCLPVNKDNIAKAPPPRVLSAPSYNTIMASAKLVTQAVDPEEMQAFLNSKTITSLRSENIKSQYWLKRKETLENQFEATQLQKNLDKLNFGDDKAQTVVIQNNQSLQNLHSEPEIADLSNPNNNKTSKKAGSDVRPTIRIVGINERISSVSAIINGKYEKRFSPGDVFNGIALVDVNYNKMCATFKYNNKQQKECF